MEPIGADPKGLSGYHGSPANTKEMYMNFRIEQLRDTILLRMGELDLTTEQVAEKADISPNTVMNLTSGRVTNPKLDVYLKVMDALELDVILKARID